MFQTKVSAENGLKIYFKVSQVMRKPCGNDDRRLLETRQFETVGHDQVVEHGAPMTVRDSPHSCREMTVESRKEAKPVLTGEIAAPILSRMRFGNGARLTARRTRITLVNVYVEFSTGTLKKLMGNTHPGDAAADDHDRSFVQGYGPCRLSVLGPSSVKRGLGQL